MTIQMLNEVRRELDKLIEKNNGDLGSDEVQEKSRELDKLVIDLQKNDPSWNFDGLINS